MSKCPFKGPVRVKEYEDGYHRVFDARQFKIAEIRVGVHRSLYKAHWLAKIISEEIAREKGADNAE